MYGLGAGMVSEHFFLRRGVIAVAVLVVASFGARTANAAQEFHLCDLFGLDDAARLVGEPIVNTVEGSEDPRFVCARYGSHSATLLEVTRYRSANDAQSRLPIGAKIAGLGDASDLIKTYDGGLVVLRVVKGPYLVALEVNLDTPPNKVTVDDLAPRVQAVLDNLADIPVALPTSRPVPTGDSGCDPAPAAAISDYLHHPDVTGVRIIGGCHYVAIATGLDDSGLAAVGIAQDICDKAVEVAYTGALNSISVESKGGRELATGIKGQLCIGVL
jgi:hypothetical protein